MAQAGNQELTEQFIQFYRNYYRDEIGTLAQHYPNEQRSLYIEYDDLYTFDADLAEDLLDKPDQLREYAEEALRLYDLPADVSLGQAHVRIRGLPDSVDIRNLRVHDNHVGRLIAVQGIVRKATDVRPKVVEAAFECQRCGTMTYIPQSDGGFQEPHECQGCERQGPFRVNLDQSEFVDAQKIRVQESPEGLRGGETPQSIDVNLEDDITGEVTAGDHVTVAGVLHMEQQTQGNEKTPLFDLYMDGVSVSIEDEEFEDMEITEDDVAEIVELSQRDDLYEAMVGSVAPSIYGYDEEKLAMILQLFSGVTKHLPDGSRIRGDLHMLLIGDPGTGKCVRGDTRVTLADGRTIPIRDIVESNLDEPKSVDDGVWDAVDFEVPSMQNDGTISTQKATKVWKREAPEKMYRIRTASGRELEVTPSHPLFMRIGNGPQAVRAKDLSEGTFVAATQSVLSESTVESSLTETTATSVAADGGTTVAEQVGTLCSLASSDLTWDQIESIESVEPDKEWVYDLEVAGTHNYISNGIVSHNSQMLSYIRNIAPRSVYTSGKGSSSAGLTAAAVRDDFGDGQQWTLEAGALVLADKGVAAVDELDKMRCVTGDTLVHTSDGITQIGELALDAAEDGTIEPLDNGQTIRDLDLSVWTMTDDEQLVERDVTAIHEYDAPAELCEVTLESGETIRTTEDHPFFVLENGERIEKDADELRPDDWVYVPEAVPQPSADGGTASLTNDSTTNPTLDQGPLTPAHGAVLGYLAGDGNVYYDREEGSYGIRFTNAEEQLLADFERSCRDAFDGTPVRHPSEQREDGVETVRLHGKEYVDELLSLGANLETYDGKRVPEGVTTAPRETKVRFLRALADAEGTVDERSVKIFSSSYELLLGAKMLLLEFGVQCQIQTRERERGRDLYILAITDDSSLSAFRAQIGFTLDRKRRALVGASERTSGDRTILDVLPESETLFADARDSLRLYQSECGLNPVTYCNFENGTANASLHRAERILDRFEQRRRQAGDDLDTMETPCSWTTLERIKDRYHVTQSELADGTPYTQARISRDWGSAAPLRETIRERLIEIVRDVSETTFGRLTALVRGDVKWRRISDVSRVTATTEDDQLPILREQLTDVVGDNSEDVVERCRALLERDFTVDTWDQLRAELQRYGISFQQVADSFGVAGSTISRWFSREVDGKDLETVRARCFDLIEAKRTEIRDVIEAYERRTARMAEPKVYDLTVDGTHNFLANGMIVHNSEDRSAMHQALEQQSYHPETEVLLADGRRVKIGEFVDQLMETRSEDIVDGVDCEILPTDDIRVHSTDLDTRCTEKTDVDRVSRHEAPDEFIEVTFSNGRSVTVTPEHPMFVEQNGEHETIPACDIETGRFVPAPRQLPNSTAPVKLQDEPHRGKEKDVQLPEEMSPALAEILGFLTAEGHSYAGSSHEIGFSNQDERLLDRMNHLMQTVFGMKSSDQTNAAGTVTKSWISTKLYRWFESNVPELMNTAREKRIPAAVLAASEEEIRRFLVGAFAGDGGVESEAMSFSTASRGLAEDYADALAKIGVAARIHHDSSEDAWKVYVMGDSTARFVAAVVEKADARHERAQEFAQRGTEIRRHHDVLPTSAAREIRSLKRLLGVRLTGQFKPHLDNGYGVQMETVHDQIETLTDRIDDIGEQLEMADDLSAVRAAIGWSGRQLADRLDDETTSAIHYAEDGGYDAERRTALREQAAREVQAALEEARQRLDKLQSRCDLRYYRVSEVKRVPNDGEDACEWVYDLTVEPANTFVSKGVVLHNSISISKAGINATLKSRCSLLGAANPKYGRFDQYEPIGEQIDLEPALISRFDLIFTVTDQPDEEKDANLAEHILTTNYAGELNTQRTQLTNPNYTQEEVEDVTDEVAPEIEPDLLRKYIAYSKRNCFPAMTDEAKEAIRDFYVDIRTKAADEDAPVPVTARKLEALVRLAEASARVRLADTVEREDAEKVIEIVRSCLQDIGVDPETGEFDADVVETGTSKSQRDRIKGIKDIIREVDQEYEEEPGAPMDAIVELAQQEGMDRTKVEDELEKLRTKGDVYSPSGDQYKVV